MKTSADRGAYSRRRRAVIAAALLLSTLVVALSPLPADLSGMGGNTFYLSGCALFLLYALQGSHALDIAKTPLALLSIALAIPSVLYWRDPALALYSIYFVVGVLVFLACDRDIVAQFSVSASAMLLAITIAAWVGFGYALAGGPSLFSIQNPDGRSNDLFLSTFSNWSIGNLIRPAGIFDEPGTLSFLICFIAALRHRLGQSRRVTWLLLVAGLITTSLAHFIYLLLHAVEDRRFVRPGWKSLALGGALVFALLSNADLTSSPESEVFISRFIVDEGRLGGDSRSDLFFAAVDRTTLETFFFGLDSDCAVRPLVCEAKGYGQFGETPAGVLLQLGVFLGAPYLFVLIATFALAMAKRSPIYLGLFLLLVQRPYVMTFGYSFLILMVIFQVQPRRFDRPLASRSVTPT